MPALYRMPVFYLLMLVGAVAYLAVDRYRPEPVVVPTDSSVRAAIHPPAIVRNETAVVEGGSADDGILRTPDGLRRKVVVKDLAVVPRGGPGTGGSVGTSLDYFAIRYLHAADPPNNPDWLQLGARGAGAQGWVPASSVLEWDTRLMARPTARKGRPRLVIYRDEACLVDSVEGRVCPRHGGSCPTQGEEPGSGDDDSKPPPLGMPILSTAEVGGHTLFEVASLVKDAPSQQIRPTEPPPDLRGYLRAVDVAFVVDTTASMQGSIDAARKLAADLVASASKRYGDVILRFALVEFRDAAPHYGFRARRVSKLTDASGFLSALKTIGAATRGDGSVDEQVFDGVTLALPKGPGDPSGEHVDWPTGRAGQLATKLVVLLGDAPDHALDLTWAEALADRAKAAGITLATVAVDRPGTLSTAEQARYRAQWRTLAEGSYRPLDKGQGFARPVEPLTSKIGAGDDLAARLQSLIDDRVEQARTIAALASAEAEGKLVEYVNSRGLTLDRVAPILVDVHRGDAAKVARPDPRSNGRKAPSVRRGWIAREIDQHPLVSVEILMARDELRALIDELTRLQQAASGTSRDLAELLEAGTAAASGETSFLAADRGSRTFADHLRRRGGLPPPRPGSLLARSQADLLHADDLSLSALGDGLRASLLRLTRRLGEPDWDDPKLTIDGMALVPLDAIDF